MPDKTDGCLSPADEEREPCLKEPEVPQQSPAAPSSNAEKNNGTAKTADNNNGTTNGGKFLTFTATSLEQKLRDKTGFSRAGLAVAAAALILCLVLLIVVIVMTIMWPRPPTVFPVCRRAACLRASAEVSVFRFITFFSKFLAFCRIPFVPSSTT